MNVQRTYSKSETVSQLIELRILINWTSASKPSWYPCQTT